MISTDDPIFKWNTDPWTITEKGEDPDKKLYGRGATDDKGPVLGWLNALQAYQEAKVDVPVNLIFCFEGMEESGSTGFAEFAIANRALFEHVDAACISDNYWLTTKKPCLTYGLRGINYFNLTVEHAGVQLHSGMFGGCVYEPMTDLVILLSKLVDSQGRILIPGINELVDDVSKEEVEEYATIEFSTQDFQETIGSDANIYNDPKETLMHRFRYPSLTIVSSTSSFILYLPIPTLSVISNISSTAIFSFSTRLLFFNSFCTRK